MTDSNEAGQIAPVDHGVDGLARRAQGRRDFVDDEQDRKGGAGARPSGYDCSACGGLFGVDRRCSKPCDVLRSATTARLAFDLRTADPALISARRLFRAS